MRPTLAVVAGFGALLSTLVQAQIQDAQLVGTWTTKSRKVLTGPAFYNPVDDRFIEPDLTGISYSFTADGWYEEAFYRAVANPTTPSCISGVMQWQHGTYTIAANKSITLSPIQVDGRQLISTPCQYDTSIYKRYYQPEYMKGYSIETDAFHNVPKLTLQQFDGSLQQPLYQVYNPPQMLPTQTLNPTAVASATGKAKRDDSQIAMEMDEPINIIGDSHLPVSWDADKFWWAGVGLVAVGGVLYMYPASK